MRVWVAAVICASSLPYGSQAFIQSQITNVKPFLKIQPRMISIKMQTEHQISDVASRRSFFEKTGATAAVILAGYFASSSTAYADTCSRKDCQPQVISQWPDYSAQVVESSERVHSLKVIMNVPDAPESIVHRRLISCRRDQLPKRRTTQKCRLWRARCDTCPTDSCFLSRVRQTCSPSS
jgi:hypothetical protein